MYINPNFWENVDSINLNHDKPKLLFGPEVEDKFREGGVPPFYVSLNIHDKILHNAMLDSGASRNLMPKVIMERLGLEINRPYKDLYSFDSSRVKCLGLIKDLCVNLAQILAKSLVMVIIVAHIPPKYGMLLSCSWEPSFKAPSKWIWPMLPYQYLFNQEDYIGKLIWNTWSAVKKSR